MNMRNDNHFWAKEKDYGGKTPVGFHLIDVDTQAVRISNFNVAFYARKDHEYEEAISYFASMGYGYGTEVVDLGDMEWQSFNQ